ncbi:MAG: RNA ligase (ATP) [Thiolinea sp.]
MSSFAVPIKRIRAIEPHPNAEAIELAVIDGYRSIIKKGEFRQGDLMAYIPEAALLPEWLLKQLKFWDSEKGRGKLNGKQGNRVNAIRLRGELSQGICYPLLTDSSGNHLLVTETVPDGVVVQEGDNVVDELGIIKYEPPIPVSMAGELFSVDPRLTLSFDVENWKSYPDILQEGEAVIFTEKLHGTCTVLAILPYQDAQVEAFGERQNILVFSKGLGAKGLVLKNNEQNRNNLYVRATQALRERIDALQIADAELTAPIFILGETFGQGVQDLNYGKSLGFRVFAVVKGYRENQTYCNWTQVEGELKTQFGFETVPVVYRGPFSVSLMLEYTNGQTTLEANHIREGIVIIPAQEQRDFRIGRVCLKSVSADYLTRKGGTEYN